MDHLTPTWAALLAPFAPCFRPEVFATFRLMVTAWVACLGRRTVSRVWQTTGRAAEQDHSPAYRLFSQAAWNWDELARILLARLLAAFVPGGRVWLVCDDTLCHKRGAKVHFGGMFLDAVLSTRRHKVFRCGTNWVTLGLVVELPFRRDRFFCVNLLWRVYAKKDVTKAAEHRTKSQLARELVELVASWLPGRELVVVGDSAYTGKHLLKGLPQHVAAVGPLHWQAVLTQPLPPGASGRRKKGVPAPAPAAVRDDDGVPWQPLRLVHPKGHKDLLVKVVGPYCWYDSAGQRPLQVVLVRDPAEQWRDEALLATDLTLTAQEVILGYMRRWSVEVAYFDGKQFLGFHEQHVWSAAAVARAAPTAWLVAALVLVWYAESGIHQEAARWERRWYEPQAPPSFHAMLACLRLDLWRSWLGESESPERPAKLDWLLHYLATAD
jgi:hypothetical protein